MTSLPEADKQYVTQSTVEQLIKEAIDKVKSQMPTKETSKVKPVTKEQVQSLI